MNNEWLNRKKDLRAEIRAELESEIRKEIQQEFEEMLEQGYEEAYQMILAEREKNNNLETKLYAEFEEKLKQQKEYIVDKVDQYLTLAQKRYECTRDELTLGKSPAEIVEEALNE